MALIYFYDATELDKQQLSAALEGTNHHWEYVEGTINPANCNPDTEVISVFVSSTVTREIIESLPNLKVIACRSTGFNNVDLATAEQHGVAVLNVPTYGEDTVAEYTFALLLALTRKLPAVFAAERVNFSFSPLTGSDLAGKTLGVIGTGHIGQNVIKIANGFSMNVLAHDIQPDTSLHRNHTFAYVSLDELLAKADIITLHIPYSSSTHHLLNRKLLSNTKSGALIVNTARGEVVDTQALIDLLTSNHLGGAALDVIEGEAFRQETTQYDTQLAILKKMPNVIISPHNAFNTTEAIGRINTTTAKNIIEYWNGNTPNKVKQVQRLPGKLIVVRHTESEWNATGRWTGVTNVHLSQHGFEQARLLGQMVKDASLAIDSVYCSEQIRTYQTATQLLKMAGLSTTPITSVSEFNERDYGDYTGKNKWEIRDEIGEEAFTQLRRGWDVPVPNGETLKMVYERAIPFYKNSIVPLLQKGENVMIVAHGNTIRALIKYLQSLDDKAIQHVEIAFGRIDIYTVNSEGRAEDSTSMTIESVQPTNS